MRKYQFQRQIIVRNIVTITILFAVLTAVFSSYIIRTSEAAFKEQVDVQLRGITGQLENTLRLADDIALQLAANFQIIEAFNQLEGYEGEQNYFVENASIDYELKQHMISYMLKQNFLGRISLFDENRNLTFVGRAVDFGYLKKDCPDNSLFTDTISYFQEGGKGSLFRIDLSDPYVEAGIPTISVFREIKNYQLIPSRCLGYVQVQIQFESFSHFGKLLGKDTECFILSQEEDQILYAFQSERKEQSVRELIACADGFAKGGLYCELYEPFEYGFKILIVAQNTSLMNNLMSTFTWVILSFCSMVLITFIEQRQIIKKTTEPIVQMCDMLDGLQVDENLQEIPLVAKGETDELRRLNCAFDELVKNLKLSMEKEMLSRINEIQSQMYALQTQMNPHFIHNILTIISAMSGTSEREKIPEICEKLSDIIRYNVNNEEGYGDLEAEILHAENYLELMKVRYEDKFQYAMVYVGEMKRCRLPRFIIQPLLENCFAHGFRAKEFPWKIDVQIFGSGDCWEIQVSDNGCGMEQEKLGQLMQELDGMRSRDMVELMKEMKIGGLSIKNVYVRLYIAYGDRMVFHMESNDTGTRITVGGNYEDTCDGG